MRQILFVYVRGGTPLAHSLPAIAACGALHVLAIVPLPSVETELWRPLCASVTELDGPPPTGDALVELIVGHAERVAADAVIATSEFAMVPVAEAATRLGLRGAGPGVLRARDKRLMRDTWADAGVPVPGYRRVASLRDLRAGCAELTPPLLLKAAWGAGSMGQAELGGVEDAERVWAAANAAVGRVRATGIGELREAGTDATFLVEEIINGSTSGWYETDKRYGPYVSVEGIVSSGTYHPISLTGRMPTVPPFIEPANLAPCVLSEQLQRRVEKVATIAVDALELDTCGTHTEIMLGPDGELTVIESAARFGGCMLVREIEDVFGLDMISMLTRELLGERVEYPERMRTAGTGAAATLAMIAADSAGRPWRDQRIWDDRELDWSTLVSAGTSVSVVEQQTLPRGTLIPRYDPSDGALNWAGIFYLRAADAETLLRDCYGILDNLHLALPEAVPAR
ncbi:ATP-grasp domain-containing protein [Solihabitans fulvus]|uniref:ATP-grasp domain-containing protein n=1 Tax=Solihabitans fulvus TaxID=1892852 RepID=A0A5B2WPN0_9PSEU|nr:ATP-grasp domain-containing protein [Solihabitans fulvus]KAA2253913.1 ATP-grasp domain-containing protein [Solihabitans fulvus]